MLVATFNMKNSYSPANPKNWVKRAQAAEELIQKRKLEVVGTQELTPRTLGSSFREFDRKEPIDHIFITEDTMKVESVLYDTEKYNGINPSDHYPTIADLSRKK